MRASLERAEGDRVVLVRLSHRNAHEIGTFLFQHFAIVGVASRRMNLCCCFRATIRVGIGECDDFNARSIREDALQSMTVIAAAGMTNDGGFEFRRGFGSEAREVSGSNNTG